MTNADAFLAAIREEPEDDTHRLVFADWLDEHGDADRAEFIRLQCALARTAGPDPDGVRLRQREGALLALHETAWSEPVRGRVRSWTFRRGFLWEVTMTVQQFRHRGDAVFRSSTVQALRLQNEGHSGRIGAAGVAHVAGTPALARVAWLYLDGNDVTAAGLQSLLSSPYLDRLTGLGLALNGLGPEGAQLLAESPQLACLTWLSLDRNHLGDTGVRALAASPHARNLRELHLNKNQVGDAGLEALATAPNLAGLHALELRCNHIGPEGVRALARSPLLGRLAHLYLDQNQVGDEGVAALANAAAAANLSTLGLRHNHVTDRGALLLAESENLSGLTGLDLGRNRIGVKPLESMLRVLKSIFGGKGAGAGVVQALAASRLAELRWLNLRGNRLGDEDRQALRARLGDRVYL
jgi:uncharacterized protein (TIGR02996 family)